MKTYILEDKEKMLRKYLYSVLLFAVARGLTYVCNSAGTREDQKGTNYSYDNGEEETEGTRRRGLNDGWLSRPEGRKEGMRRFDL